MSMSTKILVVASSRNTRKLFNTLQLTGSCSAIQLKMSFSLSKLFAPIDEILFTTSFTKNYKITPTKRVLFLCKMTLKRPMLVIQTLFLAKIFQLECENNCAGHSFATGSKLIVWYSTSAARQGFPWPYDSFLNSLRFIRDKSIDLMVFGLEVNNEVFLSETGTFENKILVKNLTSPSRDVKISITEILSWKNTKLQIVTDAEIYHGSILIKHGQLLLQDLDLDFNDFPERMTPNLLWLKKSNLDEIILNMPNCHLDVLEIDSCIFINSLTDNFYHYVSESIRVLVMAKEANIEVDNIVVRSDLPEQFYEIIQEIYSNIPITKVLKNQKVRARKVIFSQYHRQLSLEKSLFRDMPFQLVQDSDEWRTWSWLRSRFLVDKVSEISLYLPRERHQSRGILNSRYLSRKLRDSNFQILNTEHASFHLQRTKFGSSKKVCSTTGASLMNMIFMPKGTTVLEITYPSGDSWEFLANLCELNYINLPIKSVLPQTLNESLDIYIAPVSRILKSLQELKD
jgi:hypothetical protein